MAALFCVRGRCGSHLESMTSYRKYDSVNRCGRTNYNAKFHPDPTRSDGALVLFGGSRLNKNKKNNNNNSNKMSSDMGSASDTETRNSEYHKNFNK